MEDIETGKKRCVDEKTLGIGITKREYICSDGLCTIKETPDENEEKCSHNEICSSSGTFVGCTKCTGKLCDSKCKLEAGHCCVINDKQTWFSGEDKCCEGKDCCDGDDCTEKCCENECRKTRGTCCKTESGEETWYEGENRCCVTAECGEHERCTKDHRCVSRKPVGDVCDSNEECEKGLKCIDGICCIEGKECCRNDQKCDNQNPCTSDSCNQGTHECVHVNAMAGTTCGEGMICDGQGLCNKPFAAGESCLKHIECASNICCEGGCKESAAGKCCNKTWYETGYKNGEEQLACCKNEDCGDYPENENC